MEVINVRYNNKYLYMLLFCNTYLFTNSSKPLCLSVINSSSKIPPSLRKGNCRPQALLGSGGTTIYKGKENRFIIINKIAIHKL